MNYKPYLPSTILITATVFFAYDIVADLAAENESYLHIVVEFIVFLAISFMLFTELRQVKLLKTEVLSHKERTARLTGDLLREMRKQFSEWGLSPSESEVALLLIKGLSMREISEVREVKEKTIRQQATSIYSKSGYAGRHELAAHFIEDLISEAELVTKESL